MENYITIQEAAAYLGLSCQTLYGYSSEGKLLPTKMGRLNRYRKSELDNWVQKQQSGKTMRRSA